MAHTPDTRTRLVVLTDISSLQTGVGEPDDTQSLVRLLHYANDLEIEGLIATYTKHTDGCNPDMIEHVVRCYGEVRDNLARHDSRYPRAQALLDGVRGGHRDWHEVGPGKDSPGSEWIVAVLERPDPRPVWFTIWGGPHELAQALWRLEQQHSPADFAALLGKGRVYAIGDQDRTGPWIRATYPDLFYLTGRQIYRGIYKDGDPSLVTWEWVEENIHGHGPLGAAYPNYRGGDPWGRVSGIKEGDTPSFLYLLPTGLSDPEQPTWGCWGGRFAGTGPQLEDAQDRYAGQHSERATVNRWRPDFQADFQARLDWGLQPPDAANHAPIAALASDPRPVVRPGAVVPLSAAGSVDPDGDALSYRWWLYPDPGTYAGEVVIEGADWAEATLIAPAVDAPVVLHLILTVTDHGTPPLRSYRRVVITVDPRA